MNSACVSLLTYSILSLEKPTAVAHSWCTRFGVFEKSCDKHKVIIEVLKAILSDHTAHSDSFSEAYESQLERMIVAAYDWNVLVHSQGLGHYFRPFCPSVGSAYDVGTSELHHVAEDGLPNNSVVAVVASIGLET